MTNNEMQMKAGVFTTRSAAAMFLVAAGMPVNFVKAAVNETYNFDDNGASDDLIRDAEQQPLAVPAHELCMAYNTMFDMFKIVNNVIELDGEPLYDINGDHLEH